MLKKTSLLIFSLVLILSISICSSEEWAYNYLDDGDEVSYGGNYSINVNYSTFTDNWNTNIGSLSGVQSGQFNNVGGLLTIDSTYLDANWCALTGCTMTGNINMGGNDIYGIDDLTVDGTTNLTGTTWLTTNNTFVRDIFNETHHLNTDLENFDRLYANVFLTPLEINTFYNASGDYINISAAENETNIIVNLADGIKAQNYRLGYTNIILPLTAGTNETPVKNSIYIYLNGGIPTWAVSTSSPTGNHAMASRVELGATGSNPYVSSLQEDGSRGILKRIQRVRRLEGLVYLEGLDYNATSSYLEIGEGTYINGIYDNYVEDIVNSSSGFYLVHIDGSYHWYSSFSEITNYSDGNLIGNNKYFNVVFGITPYDGHGNIYAVVQSSPLVDYTSINLAYVDNDNTISIYPSEDFVKISFLPVARMIIKKGDSAQIIPNTNNLYAEDYRGGVAGGVSSGGGLSEVDPLSIHKDGSVAMAGNFNMGGNNISNGNDVSFLTSRAGKLYIGSNGGVDSNNRFWFQEQPDSTISRINLFGYPDNNASFGYTISPKVTAAPNSSQDVFLKLTDRDFNDTGATSGFSGGINLLGRNGDGDVVIYSGVKNSSIGTAGDIHLQTGEGNDSIILYETGDVIMPKGTLKVRDSTDLFGSNYTFDMKVGIEPIELFPGATFGIGVWRFIAYSLGSPGGFDAGGMEFRYDDGSTLFYNNMGGNYIFNYSGTPKIQSGTNKDLQLDPGASNYFYFVDNDKLAFGNSKDNTIYFDGTRWIFDASNVGTNQININAKQMNLGNNMRTYGDSTSQFRMDYTVDLNGVTANTNNQRYGFYDTMNILNTADSSTQLGNFALIAYNSDSDLTATNDAIRVWNNVLGLNNVYSGDVASSTITTSRLNADADYTGTAQVNFFRALNNGGDTINMPNSNGLLIDTMNNTNFTGINIGNISGENAASIRTGIAPSYFGGTVYMNDINVTNGELNIYNNSGWGVINAHDFVVHTFNKTSDNPLETFTENNNLYKINTSLVDYSRPINTEVESEYCEVPTEEVCNIVEECSYELDGKYYNKVCENKQVCNILPKQDCSEECTYEPVYEIIETQWANETGEFLGYEKVCSTVCKEQEEVCKVVIKNEVTYPYTIAKEGESYGLMTKDFEEVMIDLNQNMNLNENLTDFDTAVMSEEFYTQSKVIKEGVNYFDKLKDKEKLKVKETHFSYNPNVMNSGKSGLNMEDRIVELEGFASALMTELCDKNKNAYSWC